MKLKTVVLVGVGAAAVYLLFLRKPAYGQGGKTNAGSSNQQKPASSTQDWAGTLNSVMDAGKKAWDLGNEIYGAIAGPSGSSSSSSQSSDLDYISNMNFKL